MGSSRSRSRSGHPVIGGSYQSVFKSNGNPSGGKVLGPSMVSFTELTQDVVDRKPYPDHVFVHREKRLVPARANGKAVLTGGFLDREFSNYGFPPYSAAHIDYPPEPDVSYYLTKLLANVNPSRPVVDLPVFGFELKDFPRMLKGLGDVLGRRVKPSAVAGGYLAYQFGWRPLFNDLWSLLNLQKAIDDRIKLLQAYSRGTKLRRKLGKSSASLGNRTFLNSPGTIRLTVDQLFTEEAWFTARVKMLGGIVPTGGSDLQALAARQVLGLDVSAATIWEAIPWSWLIDYFVNIGDVLAAHRGYLPFSVSNVNLMIKNRIEYTGHNFARAVGTGKSEDCSGGHAYSEIKRRILPNIVTPILTFKPFLGLGQAAIITSLVTAKSLKAIGR